MTRCTCTPEELEQRRAEELACDRRPEFPEVIEHLNDEEKDDVRDRLGTELMKLDLDEVETMIADQRAGRKGHEALGAMFARLIRKATRKTCESIEDHDPERWDGMD